MAENNYTLDIVESKELIFDTDVPVFKLKLHYAQDKKILICEYTEYDLDAKIIFANNITLFEIQEIVEKLEVKSKNLRQEKLKEK